ncbi:MAG: bifunctional DNA-formamidopyrimidine glycosylase/DNA-(apurinic or apyrimidinic site) lyase [Methyloceanibacter sp.]|jgi:formamidopyrimidine-DNA glycosylase
MPELPEVETVRLGLAPVIVGNSFRCVEQRRKDLRFPLPQRFAQRLEGRTIDGLDRRAKYLLARLDDGVVLVMHLGMTGRFRIAKPNGAAVKPDDVAKPKRRIPKHEHIVFHFADGAAVRYSDTRRFGFMDLIPGAELENHALFKRLGVEPLSEDLTPEWLALRLKGKTASIKAALLDQRLIAGLGNIYVCEALFRARISPVRKAGTLATETGKPTKETEALVESIKTVLQQALGAGGSSLRDYARTDGRRGRFQYSFRVYRREEKPCRSKGCRGIVRRIVQSGRSTFYCSNCQR